MHPYGEGTPLMEFFPHDAEQAYRTMAKLDPFYGTTTKTVGGSPFEHIYQHRNTVIALYDIPDIRRFPFMVGFLPMQTVSFDVDSVRTGWITNNAGDVYLAYFPLRPGQLLRENRGRRLFSPFGKNGAVVQIASAKEAGSYSEFRKRILRSVPDTSDFFRHGRVRYNTIFKARLDARIGGGLRVNNKPVSHSPDMLFDSPWITSRRGSGVMTIKTPRGRMEIDIKNAHIQTRQ